MSICLTMIVKNEEHVIARAIESVRGIIDRYAIVDTGSTDNTREVALRALDGLTGSWSSHPWTDDYGAARTLSLIEAKKGASWRTRLGHPDYSLIVDADDIWSGCIPDLTDAAPGYAVWFQREGGRFATTRLLRTGIGIRYEGVVHEMPVMADGTPVPAHVVDGLTVTSPGDGATWKDPEKYMRHARIISKALIEDPTNLRYAFYLAQSYREQGDDARAAQLYLARASMGPGLEPEQVYISFLEAGRALWRLGRHEDAKRSLLNAHASFPGRREAMAELARLFAVKAATSPTVGTLFVETGYDEPTAEAAQ